MPHAPDPQLERAADIVLGLVHAVEMMTFNPLRPECGQLSPYGLADWYRYLNLGYQLRHKGVAEYWYYSGQPASQPIIATRLNDSANGAPPASR